MLIHASNQVNFFTLNEDIDDLTSVRSFELFDLFNQFIKLENLIPLSFYRAYYAERGNDRTFPLEGMIKAIIVAQLIGIPTTNLLILIISISKEFRHFLGFKRPPHKSQFSRFKNKYHNEIKTMFQHMVNFTEPYAQLTDEFLSSLLVTDTTGFELYVKENNPKFFQTILKSAKNYAKAHPENKKFDPEKYAQGKMPKVSPSNNDAKFAFLNGHFGYYRKAIISTNGFGLVRDINFFDKDNQLVNDLTPNEVKDLYDSKSLIPTLESYFTLHPHFQYDYFLGDSAFDADDNYAYLHNKNIMPIIPINPRNDTTLPEAGFNQDGVPTCPYDPELPMVYAGMIRSDKRADRVKYICPKRSKKVINGKVHVILDCDHPCTSSKYGRIKNLTVNHNFRYHAAIPRSSEEWIQLYKHRTVSERSINQLKSFISIETSKVRKTQTLESSVFLAGITQLIAFLILFHNKYATGPLAIRSLIS